MTRPHNPEVDRIVAEIVEKEGFELVEFGYKTGRNTALQVIVHRLGGTTIDDCSRLSRRIDQRLEEADLIVGSWRIDVASPGLDRPLRTPADFKRVVGERIRLDLSAACEDKKSFEGLLVGANGVSIRLADKSGERDVPLDHIRYGKIVVKMP